MTVISFLFQNAGADLSFNQESSNAKVSHRESHALRPVNRGTIREIPGPITVVADLGDAERVSDHRASGTILSAGASLKVRDDEVMSSPVTVHVLDTSVGLPAEGIPIRFYRQLPSGSWTILQQG